MKATRFCLTVVAFFALAPVPSSAVNGIAASIASRYSRDMSLVPERYHSFQGKLVLFHIQNSATVRCDTLYKGLADFPAFNAYGDKIAFWREGDTIIDNKLVRRLYDHLSIINVDGTGLRDLVTITGDQLTNSYYYKDSFDRQCQWPLGDWVYYIYPRTAKIYRVNVNDTTKNELVVDYSYGAPFADVWIMRWCLSANGKYAAMELNPGTPECLGSQTYVEFPGFSPTDPCNGTDLTGYAAGCNCSMSPSAKYGSAYRANGHTCTGIHKLNWTNHTLTMEGVRKTNVTCMDSVGLKCPGLPCSVLPHCRSIYYGAEWTRWAKNSDKWYMHRTGIGLGYAECGTNQLIMDWYTPCLFFSSNNPHNPDSGKTTISYCNDTGDFFVFGGPAGTIEDTLGNWVPIDGGVAEEDKRVGFDRLKPQRMALVKGSNFSADISGLTGPFLVSVYDLSGKQVDHFTVDRLPLVLRQSAGRGSFLVRITQVGHETSFTQVVNLL